MHYSAETCDITDHRYSILGNYRKPTFCNRRARGQVIQHHQLPHTSDLGRPCSPERVNKASRVLQCTVSLPPAPCGGAIQSALCPCRALALRPLLARPVLQSTRTADQLAATWPPVASCTALLRRGDQRAATWPPVASCAALLRRAHTECRRALRSRAEMMRPQPSSSNCALSPGTERPYGWSFLRHLRKSGTSSGYVSPLV